ncbi:chitinase-like protein Idgf3 [Drosophila grimshawi]|uniref:GH25191 n=1 Tax=Drosophila grimshawi TaxID=7222 RepID=B4JZ68_DROGR|nr:chitinase-like protein Idgf3 [Drosophila grimshawi]EDV94177.1 GH25191 [Drosophila grimshawi]
MLSLRLGLALTALLSALQLSSAAKPHMVCYYDSLGFERRGLAQFTLTDMELALQFCTHVIYGYAGINPDTFELNSLNPRLDFERRHYAQITVLKEKYPYVKFLLSVGGDRDLEQEDKYIKLLESGLQGQKRFIDSARDVVRRFNFDGVDLAFQLPRNKPRKVHSDVGMAWKSFKKFFTGDFVVDTEAETHKEQLTGLVSNLNTALKANDLLLSLTVLPNVNSTWYFDVPAIGRSVDFVNLATFDFVTPTRNPEEADYSSPLYEVPDQSRLPHYNVNFQMEHWLLQRMPASKLNIGIASYGRAWKLTTDSGTTGQPVVAETNGPAPAGSQSKTDGLLNWAEICQLLPNPSNVNAKGNAAPLRRVSDSTKRLGSYAYRAANEDGEYGMWVSYDDPDTAASKAQYVRAKNLGGVALFDLTQDDFRGQCTGDRFPMLRAIKYRLL